MKLLVVGSVIRCLTQRYSLVALHRIWGWSGYFKHEDLGASPQMAKRLEDILRSKE